MANIVCLLKILMIVSAVTIATGYGMGISESIESPPPPGVPDEYCDVPFTSLLSCLPAVLGIQPPLPNSTCCVLLSHAANLHCLCHAIRVGIPSRGPRGEPVNHQAVDQLPKNCKMNVPKNFTC